MNGLHPVIDRFLFVAIWLWIAITALFVICNFALFVWMGSEGFSMLIQQGPSSVIELTLASVAVVWLSCGVTLILLQKTHVRLKHGVSILCSLILVLLYVNFLREITYFGDLVDYIKAAYNLHDGVPFHSRYIYPPFLATICQPFLWLGKTGLAGMFWLTNIVSLVLFFWLLKEMLMQYGFSHRLSLCLVFLFMVVNVAILRTLTYGQINLHVMNLIFLTLLLYPRHRFLSALALAVAVNLKTSPFILVLLFLWVRDRKWLMSFLASMTGIVGLTVVFYGWTPFWDYYKNVTDIYSTIGICFRDNSIDSLIRSTALLLNADLTWAVILFKAPILGLIFLTGAYNIRHSTFSVSKETDRDIRNAVPAFLILMVIASPLVSVHHAVFLAIPFLLIMKKLERPYMWVLYCFAYLFEFLVPTFEFYPWSYGRLLSPIILTFLMFKIGRQPDSKLFLLVQNRLDSFSWVHGYQPGSPADMDNLRR